MRSIEFDRVTTRTGDGGKTSTYSGAVDWKDAPVFEVLGDLDELSSWLGVIKPWGHRDVIEAIQTKLLQIGSLVATAPGSPLGDGLKKVTAEDVFGLEAWEKGLLDTVVIEPVFVLPGSTPESAWTDVARTVCRRAERRMVTFVRDTPRPDLKEAARYLNRLSDALFILARSRD